MALVTYDQAKAHLGVGDEHAVNVRLKMEQASAMVIGYIKRPEHGWTSQTNPAEDGEFAIVQAAILRTLGDLFRDRGDEEPDWRADPVAGLKPNVRASLSMLRDPALA